MLSRRALLLSGVGLAAARLAIADGVDQSISINSSQGVSRARPPLMVVANHGMVYTAVRTASAGNLICGECRVSLKTGKAASSELRFVVAGFYIASSGVETNAGNDQQVEIAVEWPGKSTQQVKFGAQNVGTITNGAATYVSDPIYPAAFGMADFPANTQFWFRTRRVVTSGQNHTKTVASGVSGEGTFYSDGLSASQLLGTGTMSIPPGGTSAGAEFGPCAVLGRPIGAPDIAVLIVGDSIVNGNNDSDIGGNGSDGGGWAARGLWSVNGRSVPWTKCSQGSTTAQELVAGGAKRGAYFAWHTHAIVNYGTNDLQSGRTAAQTWADLQTIYATLKAAGIRHVEQSLIFPRESATTDSWATAAGQTPLTGFETGGTKRDPLNASIAGLSAALDAYLDLNGAVADATLTDRYAVNGTANYGTSDGVHPQPVLHTLAGALFAARVASWR